MKNEMKSIDIAKFFFCICIVCLHTNGLNILQSKDVEWFLQQSILRLAVPFFFISSGYFFGVKWNVASNDDERKIIVKDYCLRLLKPLVIFESINILIPLLQMALGSADKIPAYLLSEIPKILFYPEGALWYVQASIVGVIMIYVMRNVNNVLKILIGGVDTYLL